MPSFHEQVLDLEGSVTNPDHSRDPGCWGVDEWSGCSGGDESLVGVC